MLEGRRALRVAFNDGASPGLSSDLMNETPEVIVELMPSGAPPSVVGKLGVRALAPALANALLCATGIRARRLPLFRRRRSS